MKLIDSMKKRDKESYPIPKSIQQWMPIHRVYPDGIFLYRDRYSKTFRFTDVNYKIYCRSKGQDLSIGINNVAFDPTIATNSINIIIIRFNNH